MSLQIGKLSRATFIAPLCLCLLAACDDNSGRSAAGHGVASAPIAASSATGNATLSWQPPLTNTDGSMLTDLVGYRIYYGTSLDSLTNVVELPQVSSVIYTVTNLTAGTWYFVVRSYNAAGVESESDPSIIASKTIV
jgi:hypothetical protein